MRRHECRGDGCPRCEQAIAEAESHADERTSDAEYDALERGPWYHYAPDWHEAR